MSLAAHKQAAVRVEVGQLRDELARWRALSDADGAQLARHCSQIDRIAGALEAGLSELDGELEGVSGAELDVIEECALLQSKVLDLHRAWEYYRSKLAQRLVEQLTRYLVATDDLAWACYQPPRDRAIAAGADPAAVREPPLTFLNGGANPFMLTRGESLMSAIPDGGVRNERLKSLVGALPVPVIGLPWSHLGHLPDAVVVAHEVGHVVEDDLGLAPEVRRRIEAAIGDAERASAWSAWSHEAFADVFATVATGPAYTSCLTEFVAGGRREVVKAKRSAPDWGDYPTPALRVALSAAACECIDAPATEILADWRAAYPEHAMAGWEDDAASVAKALVACPYGELDGKRLDRSPIALGGSDWQAVTSAAASAIANAGIRGSSVRALVATARECFRSDPGAYADGLDEKILCRIVERSDGAKRARARDPDGAARTQTAADRVLAILAEPETTTLGDEQDV